MDGLRLHRQRSRFGVDRGPRAERNGELPVAMAESQPAQHRHAKVVEAVLEHRDRVPLVGCTDAVGDLADDHAGDPGQHTHPAQLGQHHVDAVRRLVDVLEEQNGVVERRGVTGAQ
ncbi:hypothetical protein GCM10027614_15190 [Micromonospora vulcania]